MNSQDGKSLVADVERLTPIQREILQAIVRRFTEEIVGQHLRDDFLTANAYEYFSTRLAVHHAYSSSTLKKENFEHVLREAFERDGAKVETATSMTHPGADLTISGVPVSLKTEAAKGLREKFITISKLMEAAWIKQVSSLEDVPGFIRSKVTPHFGHYERVFILRSYADNERKNFVRYDLREIPNDLLQLVADLTPADFSTRTRTGTTSADVRQNGRKVFKFRLDGSDDKITINNLDVDFCPLHAWWSLLAPT